MEHWKRVEAGDRGSRLRVKVLPAILMVLQLLMPVSVLLCQEQEESHTFRMAVEELLATTDDADPALLLDELADLQEFPVRINSGDEHEISRLFFLNSFQVMVLADHIRNNGPLETLYEAALLPGFDRTTVMLMAHCVTLSDGRATTGTRYSRTVATLSVTTRFSRDEEEWEGARSLLKIKHDQPRIGFGLTAENDPGERFGFTEAAGTDFLSGYFMVQGGKTIREVIIGDYRIRSGEGVLFNSGRWMGSWLSSPAFMNGASRALPYRSTDENNFFRGISMTLGTKRSSAILFASSNRVDARLVTDDEGSVTGVSHLVIGGQHVTPSQLEARKRLRETVTGMRITLATDRVTAGLITAATWFSLPFTPDLGRAENLHAFVGDRLLSLAADFRAGSGPLLVFGEAAVSHAGSLTEVTTQSLTQSVAATAGLRLKPAARVTCNVLMRYFTPGYHAPHSGASKNVSGAGNETGMAVALHLEAARHLFVTAAADHYRVPWARYRSAAPSAGSRIEVRSEYLPRDELSLRLFWTLSSREYDTARERGTALAVRNIRQQAGGVIDIRPLRQLSLTTRVTISHIDPSAEKGYLLCQDLSYSLQSAPLKVWFRYALCSTGGWDSRLYAWESDLLSAFSVPALYGEMRRSFIMLSWKMSERSELRLKYAFTGSVKDEGHLLREELRGQLKVAF